MSDPRMPPMGGPPMGGSPQMPPGGDPVRGMEENRSMFNPADATMSIQEGKIRPDMSVREFLQENMGIDVEGPVTQLIEASKKQLQNRTAIGKAASMGGQPQQPGQVGRPAMVQPGQNPMTPGLDSMMKELG